MTRPSGAYSRSKAESELIARRYQEEGAPVVTVYPGGVIGPDDPYLGDTNRTIAEFAKSGRTMRGGAPMVDVRDVTAVHAAVMETGRGPRRYMITGHYVDFPDLVATLQQITGRRGRIAAMPAGVTLAAGRVADLMQRLLPGRLPVNYEGIWISALQPHGDDSRTASELGITARDLRVTLTDTVRWLTDQGHLPPAAKPADAHLDCRHAQPSRDRHVRQRPAATGSRRVGGGHRPRHGHRDHRARSFLAAALRRARRADPRGPRLAGVAA